MNKNQWEQKVVLSYLANGIQKIYLLFLLLLLFAGENKILHKKQIFSNYQIWLKTSKFDANKSFLMTPEFFFFFFYYLIDGSNLEDTLIDSDFSLVNQKVFRV